MKTHLVVLTLAISFLVACASPATKITRSWSSPEKNTDGYKRRFVAAIVGDITRRQAIETNIDAELRNLNVSSITSTATIKPNFGGFWGWNHSVMMSPGHVVNDERYFLEINVYDTESELLVWSAQSETLNPRSLETFSAEFSRVVIQRMRKDGVLDT